ncbi:MAG: pimeloyl-ACP methyl ester carboxylesterase, partial [Candidatus Marinamargulisbacteria bacterium]
MIFPYINRGKPLTVIWVPGWATLPGLYESVCRHANSLICHPLDPNTFDATLTHSLKKHNIQTATIVGFSLGCFLSASYAKNNPEQIFRTVLIGMRPAYDAAQIRHIQASLTENKKGYLSAFFKSSFHETSEFRTFLTQHFKPT